ncbi:hypothetical protein [Rufibacter soli]
MQLALLPAAPQLLHVRLSRAIKTRMAFTMADYRFILANYTHGWYRAHQVAAKLNRSTKSLERFIERHPELQKHPRKN